MWLNHCSWDAGTGKKPENLQGTAHRLPFVWGLRQQKKQRKVVAHVDSSCTFCLLTFSIPHSHTLALRPAYNLYSHFRKKLGLNPWKCHSRSLQESFGSCWLLQAIQMTFASFPSTCCEGAFGNPNVRQQVFADHVQQKRHTDTELVSNSIMMHISTLEFFTVLSHSFIYQRFIRP